MTHALRLALEDLEKRERERHEKALAAIQRFASVARETAEQLGEDVMDLLAAEELTKAPGDRIDIGADGQNDDEASPPDAEPEPDPGPPEAPAGEASEPDSPLEDEPPADEPDDPPPITADKVLEALERGGDATVTGIADWLEALRPSGTPTPAAKQEIEEGLAHLEAEGQVEVVGKRGRGLVWGVIEEEESPPDPKPAGPAPRAPAPARTASREARKDRNISAAAERDEHLLRELDATLRNGPKSVPQLFEELDLPNRGMTRAALLSVMKKSGRFETWGGKDQDGKALWRRRPRADETEGVTITQTGEQDGTLPGKILARLRTDPSSIPELAEWLEERPVIVAGEVSVLEREREVQKMPGGRYMVMGI